MRLTEWVKDLQYALAAWILKRITPTLTGYSVGEMQMLEPMPNAEIIEMVSLSIEKEDAFRLVLQRKENGVAIETDVCSSNFIQHVEYAEDNYRNLH